MMLRKMGLTNCDSEDYGTFCTAKPVKCFALCCGRVVEDKSKDYCGKCRLALFWQTVEVETAERRIEQYLYRWKK